MQLIQIFKICLIAASLSLASCATQQPAKIYSAPSLKPVKERITSAQSHVSSAQSSARVLAEETKDKSPAWQTAYNSLSSELDKAYLDLVSAQTRADEVQAQNVELAQAATRESQDKANAQAKEKLTAFKYHRVKFVLAAVAAGAVLLALAMFGKALLAIPYVGIGVFVGGPAAAALAVIFYFSWFIVCVSPQLDPGGFEPDKEPVIHKA